MSEATFMDGSSTRNPTVPGVPDLPKQDIPIPQRNTYVAAWYLEQPHEDMAQQVWEETEHGRVPLMHRGVAVTIGMVPPEHRYAVRPDGTLREQREFAEMHERHYLGFFALMNRLNPGANIKPDDPNGRFVPNVRRFITERPGTVRADGRGYCEIGYDPHERSTAPAPPPAPSDPNDPVVDRVALAGHGFSVKTEDDGPDPREAELERLRAENEALRAKAEAQPARKPRPKVKAPCGKELGGAVHFHVKGCDECQALQGDTGGEAA